MNIAIFASGRGSNFSAIAQAVRKGKIKAKLVLLVCDNPEAGVLAKAKRAGVKAEVVLRKDFAGKLYFERKIIEHLTSNKVDLIVLAGFMRILGPEIIKRYRGRMINIHPSLLPAFKGAEAIKDAFNYGVKVTGVTVHFVDEEMDHGPVIMQKEVLIKENDTLASLEARIHKAEHLIYPQAINLAIKKRLKLEGRKVRVFTP